MQKISLWYRKFSKLCLISLSLLIFSTLSISANAIYTEHLDSELWQYLIDNSSYQSGSADAEHTIIILTSVSCPHCQYLHNKVVSKLEKNYVQTGKLRLVLINLILSLQDLEAFTLANCFVEPERHAKFIKTLYQKSHLWLGADYKLALKSLAKLAGMTVAEYNICMNNMTQQNNLQHRSYEISTKLFSENISTPYILIDQHVYNDKRNYSDIAEKISD